MPAEPATSEYLDVIRRGIVPVFGLPSRPKRVIIVGAGVAGLVAGYELLRAGHDPLILEARNRVGGRICTLRDPFSSGLYGEAGAMRIPRAHALTMMYIDRFGLPTADFVMESDQTWVHIGGVKRRLAEVRSDPDVLGFETAPAEKGRLAGDIWAETIRPLVEQVEQHGQAGWDAIYAVYDEYSVREFLELKGWSEGLIEMFGLLNNQEALMNSSFLELFREEAGNYYTNMCQIVGGMDRFVHAFLPELEGRIRYGARVIALDQTPDQAIVHYQTLAGRFQATGDDAIITTPFPVLRHVEVLKPFSRAKQRAIRQLHYDAAAKIFFQCRRRFWETDDGIYGDGTVTDLPIRNLYIPIGAKKPGVVCCSPVIPGRRMRNAGGRSHRATVSSRRWRMSPSFIRRSPQSSRSVHRICGTMMSLPAARSRCSIRDSRRCSTMRLLHQKGASTLPANMHRCTMPGSRERSSLGCVRRLRYTRRHSSCQSAGCDDCRPVAPLTHGVFQAVIEQFQCVRR